MKVLVVPDIHLKPHMFKLAEDHFSDLCCDTTVFLGDFCDDWGKQNNVNLYEQTLDALEDYLANHPSSLVCWGNHDLAYLWGKEDHPGYSFCSSLVVKDKFEDLIKKYPDTFKIVHRIDNCIFSHGGITAEFLRYFYFSTTRINCNVDKLISEINQMKSSELWVYSSPIWARPDYSFICFSDSMQVVGHTPVQKLTVLDYKQLIICDTFSTYQNGDPIGDQTMLIIDSTLNVKPLMR